MNRDISAILAEWDYQAGQLSVRIVPAEDGEPRLQVRLDLGILQMHLDGRPDGELPYGFRSLLDYYESQFELPRGETRGYGADDDEEADDDAIDSTSGDSAASPSEPDGPKGLGDLPFEARQSLSAEDCRQLREELSQFNQRAVSLGVMDDYERVIRDATRNLRVLDLCKEKAESEADQSVLEQYRPYFIAMRYRAMANMAIRDAEPKAAVVVLDEGLEALKACYAAAGKPKSFDQSSEAQSLRAIREGLVPQLPLSQKAELRRRLADALAQENYELAAILRDELKQLKD